MNVYNIYTKKIKRQKTWSLYLLFSLALLLFANQELHAQTKILANEVSYTNNTSNCGGFLQTPCRVENPSNALEDNDDYARLLASPGLAVGLGAYNGVIELKFNQTLPADQWSYVRIAGNNDLLRALLGGSLGELLGDVLGAVLIGNQEITIDARMGNSSILARSSNQSFNTDRVKLLEDADGNFNLAIRPDQDYDRIRITNGIGSLLGVGNEVILDVYYAYTYDPTEPATNCGRPLATSFDGGGGIGLEVLDLNDQNLALAIDNDAGTYSQVKSTAVLGVDVAATLSQHFYYPTLSTESTTANIKLALGSGGLVNTDLLGAIEVVFYDNTTIVSRRSLQSSLLNNTNALALLDNGNPVILTFAPGKAFDRIEVKLNSPVGLNLLGNGVKIYDVERYDDTSGCSNPNIAAVPTATADPFEEASCATNLVDFENVDFAQRAVDGNNESYATIYADAGNLLVSGPTAGFIEMDLGQTLPANKTTYVRINYDEDVLDALLGGSLGKLVSDLANNLLLGNQFFEVEAKNNASSVLSASSIDAFANTDDGIVTLVQDNIGRYYLAITPNAAYNTLRITNNVTAALSTGKQASLDVYNACFEIGTDLCYPANFTSYKGEGLNLSLGDISKSGVKNPFRAISSNSSEYSEINLGVLGVAANVYQTIYFNNPSQVDDKVKIRMQFEPSSVLSLDLLGDYEVNFYNGAALVNSHTLQQGLLNNIDLLGLFNTGGIVELEYQPTGIFDRVDIGAATILEANVSAPPLRVYSVQRYGDTCPLAIADSPFDAPTCATELIASSNAHDVQNLFDEDFDSFATLNSGAGILLGANQFEGFVELGYDHMVPANTTSYIRIDFEESILENLVGGSLGNVVSGLLDGLALGDHYFEVDVKHNGESVSSASSGSASAGGNNAIRVVRDKEGRYYIAVTPNQPYNSVRITDKTKNALGLLSQPNTMNVYGMCYEGSTDTCLEAFATSYEFSGLNLSVNDLGQAGVTNPHYTLNDNSNQASGISNGTLSLLGGGVKQWIFFNTVSSSDDVVHLKMRTQGGLVDLSLLGTLKVQAHLGNNLVKELSWGNGLIDGINVLDLLSNGDIIELPFAPGVPFDRISVGIDSPVVEASVFPPLELYSVTRCNEPVNKDYVSWKSFVIDNDTSLTSVKGGEEVTYTIHIRNLGEIDLLGMQIEDLIPANTSFVSASVQDLEPVNGKLTFTGIDLVEGATETVSFTVKVNENLTGVTEILNTALVKLNEYDDRGTETFPPDAQDPNEPDTSGDKGTKIPVEAIKSVVSWKAYTIGDADKTSTAVSGAEELTYHIYVKNTGNQDLNNVLITDELPAGLSHISGGSLSGNTVSFTIPSLAVGATSSAYNFKVKVNEDLTGIEQINNIAVVKPDANESDTFESFPPQDNTVTPTQPDTTATPGTKLDVTAIHDMEISKIGVSNNAVNTQAIVGDEITYTVVVKNTGNKKLTNIQVGDQIPAELIIIDDGGANVSGGVLTYTIAELAVNEELSFVVVTKVDNLDSGVTEIVNTATATFRNEEDTGDKTVTDTFSMPTACTPIADTDVVLTPSSLTVCEGDEFTITASTTLTGLVDPEYKWYTNPGLTGTPYEGDVLTTSLTETTTYYVRLSAEGYCMSTPATEVTVTVNPDPEIPSLSANGSTTNLCPGDAIELTTSSVGAVSYEWYLDGVLIDQATESTYKPSVSGSYTVKAVNATGCDSEASAAIEIEFLPVLEADYIDIEVMDEVCEGDTVHFKASLSGTAPSNIQNPVFKWYLKVDGGTDELLHEGAEFDGQATQELIGDHTVYVTLEADNYCANATVKKEHDMTVYASPIISVDGNQSIYVALGQVIPWPTVTAVDEHGVDLGDPAWFDIEGNPVQNLPTSFTEGLGARAYTAVFTSANGCEASITISIRVYDPTGCPPIKERVYANSQSWGSIITGGVANRPNAVDGNPKTYSTITTGVGLLGIGTTWQNLFFDHEVPAGTPVTIKVGKEYSGLAVAGGLSVVGIRRDGLGTPVHIGTLQPVAGGLLDLLVADNVVEFTFVPSNTQGAQPYIGVQISSGAVLSVAQLTKVYGAYYTKDHFTGNSGSACTPVADNVNSNVQDVLHGVKDLGLGLASATASVVNPWNAVDDDVDTYTDIVRGVAALNAAFLTPIFKQPAQPTDELQIIMEDPSNNGLTLNLLTGFQFQRYMGDTPVGDPIQGGKVLDLKLLNFREGRQKLIVGSFDEQPYDRVQIAYGSIVEVGLGDQVKIYDVSIRPKLSTMDDKEDFNICSGGILTLKKQDDCTFYNVYDEDGNKLDMLPNDPNEELTGYSFQTEELEPGQYTFTVEAVRDGCVIGHPQEINVIVEPVVLVDKFEVRVNNPANPTEYNVDATIDVSPMDNVLISLIFNPQKIVVEKDVENEEDGSVETITEEIEAKIEEVIWEILLPTDADNNAYEWSTIEFGSTDPDTWNLELAMPDFGEVTLEDGSAYDIRNRDIKVRATVIAESECPFTAELTLKIDGKSKLMVNPNITNKLKSTK